MAEIPYSIASELLYGLHLQDFALDRVIHSFFAFWKSTSIFIGEHMGNTCVSPELDLT